MNFYFFIPFVLFLLKIKNENQYSVIPAIFISVFILRFGTPITINTTKDISFKQIQVLIRKNLAEEVRTVLKKTVSFFCCFLKSIQHGVFIREKTMFFNDNYLEVISFSVGLHPRPNGLLPDV